MSENTAPQGTIEMVGGRAVEQDLGLTQGSNENREAAIEAVRKATKAASKAEKPSTEPPEKGEKSEAKKPADKAPTDDETNDEDEVHSSKTREPVKESKGKPEADEDAFSLKRVLKQKEKLAREKKEASENYQREAQQLAEQRRQVEEYHRQVQEQAKFLDRLRQNPVEAVREAGWDPEQFVYDLAAQGTPEGKQAAELRKMQEQLRQHQEWQQNLVRQQQQALQRQQEHQQLNYRAHIEQRFLERAMNESKPFTAAFYKGREAALISEGDILAAQYRNMTGKEVSPEEIADYIEEELASRANSWYDMTYKARQASVKTLEDDNLEEVEEAKPKVRKVGKTLGDEGSERRATSKTKDLKSLDHEELIEEAKNQVKLALAKQRRNDD